jgi:hypothetical protein
MPRSTAYRYINSLRSYALIEEDANGGFRLGPRIFPLARVAKASASVLTMAAPHLAELNRKFSESVTLLRTRGSRSHRPREIGEPAPCEIQLRPVNCFRGRGRGSVLLARPRRNSAPCFA